MIKTSKTKFSYARKAFALPLFFSVAFACVVHAQNSEIKATNNEIARAVNQIEKTDTKTITTTETTSDTDIVVNADEGNVHAMESEPSVDAIQQSELKIGDLEQQIRQIEETLETLNPGSDEAALKFNQIAALSEQISELFNAEDFKNAASAIHEHTMATFDARELELMTEKLARSNAAQALEEANIAMQEAASARIEAKLIQKEAARVKIAADIVRKKAALTREQVRQIKEQAKEALNTAE